MERKAYLIIQLSKNVCDSSLYSLIVRHDTAENTHDYFISLTLDIKIQWIQHYKKKGALADG